MNLGTQKVKREVSLLLCHRSLHPNPTHLTLCPILFSCKCMFLFIYVACPCVDIISVVLLCRDTGTWCYILVRGGQHYWYQSSSWSIRFNKYFDKGKRRRDYSTMTSTCMIILIQVWGNAKFNGNALQCVIMPQKHYK